MPTNARPTTAMTAVEKAAACDVNPASSRRIIVTAATVSCGVVKKTTAERVTMDRINRKKKTETSIGATKGR